VKIVCKYCQDYMKILQKFNPTKARAHLTAHCTGVNEALRKTLLESTQGMKKSQAQQIRDVSDYVMLAPSFSSTFGACAPATVTSTSARYEQTQQLKVPTSFLMASSSSQRRNDSYHPRPPSSVKLSFHPDNANDFLVSAHRIWLSFCPSCLRIMVLCRVSLALFLLTKYDA
jgi:hypothetical protein